MFKIEPCSKCHGTGKQKNRRSIGTDMRVNRIRSGKSLRKVAELMGFTPAYLSDLELGKRSWSDKLVEQFEKAVGK